MRRNSQSSESSQRGGGSSSMLTGLMSLAGGIGIGAGILYLLDPDKGQKRRHDLLSSASDLASSAKDYAGEAFGHVGSALGGALGSARDYAGEKLSSARDYADDAMGDAGGYASNQMRRAQRQARDFIQRQTFGETRSEHRMGVTLCALSSMALGAAVMYAFDPASGRNRRRYVREQAGNLASEASNYAHQASQAIRSGIEQAKEKVGMGATPSPDSQTGAMSSSGGMSQPSPTNM
jgi:hypothetical protein